MRVLAVEDEVELAYLLKKNLAQRGLVADIAATVAEAEACLDAARYDLMLLDRRLQDEDGLVLLRRLRAANNGISVIVITARDALEDRVEGLNLGADDYLVKPFAIEELIARINAVSRRPTAARGVSIEIGNLAFNFATSEVLVDDAPLVLPRRELATLQFLMRAAGRVVIRDSLMEGLYGFDDEPSSNAVDATVSRLRRHLRSAGAEVRIVVVRGVGYMIAAAP
jgi:DNA-binding response OmpR family regulator